MMSDVRRRQPIDTTLVTIMVDRQLNQARVRLAEVVASLCLATDLATGQPLEHGLRRTLLAVWLGEACGLNEADLHDAYYVALLGAAGCLLDGAALAGFVKDEILLRAQMGTLDPTRHLQVAAFFLRQAGAGDPPLRRLRKVVALPVEAQRVCRDVALHVGDLLDLGPAIRDALGHCDEHWSGTGPLRLKGEQISLAARLFLLAHDAETFNRLGGPEAARSVVQQRAGKLYDPRLAARFGEIGPRLLMRLQSEPCWDAVLAGEPTPVRRLAAHAFDDVAQKVANFVDMRSAYTVGHSPRVAALAEAAACGLGLSTTETTAVRQAGLFHDLGRAGVPVAAWNKRAPLTAPEWERMRRHPSLTELILARSSALGHLGTLAGLHHERLDGSGYRGLSAASLPVTARLLAAADAYQTKREARPHRPALSQAAAAEALQRQADTGQLDADVVTALLAAAGQKRPPKRRDLPAGLSAREVEVLSLAVRGLSNRQMAEALFLSPKTVGHHLERIYDKIGVSTRVGATLFALQHGLVDDTTAS
jgi:HD-GYP domain-containing protein (c-di-GMP phosphodiesterase class II)